VNRRSGATRSRRRARARTITRGFHPDRVRDQREARGIIREWVERYRRRALSEGSRGVPADMCAKRRRPKVVPWWILPPRSVVECVRSERRTGAYAADVGRRYRIGYYGACRDGLGVVWLVDARGEYVATTEHEHLWRYFRVVRRSDETDYFADTRRLSAPFPAGVANHDAKAGAHRSGRAAPSSPGLVSRNPLDVASRSWCSAPSRGFAAASEGGHRGGLPRPPRDRHTGQVSRRQAISQKRYS